MASTLGNAGRGDPRIEVRITDINMPGMDGYELAAKASRMQGLQVVVVSGKAASCAWWHATHTAGAREAYPNRLTVLTIRRRSAAGFFDRGDFVITAGISFDYLCSLRRIHLTKAPLRLIVHDRELQALNCGAAMRERLANANAAVVLRLCLIAVDLTRDDY
jgi:CheY-like chemotaxis protein